MADALKTAVEPGVSVRLVTLEPPYSTEMESGVSTTYTEALPFLLPFSAVITTSPPFSGVINVLPSSSPSLTDRS